MTPEVEADFLDLVEEGTMPAKRRTLFRAVWSEIEELREELEIHRAANRPCLCPDTLNTPHASGCPHPLRVLKERDALLVEVETLKDQLDAAYDAHAGECLKCRTRWAQLRESRGAV